MIHAAVMGYGTIGSGVAEILAQNAESRSRMAAGAGGCSEICSGFERFSRKSCGG